MTPVKQKFTIERTENVPMELLFVGRTIPFVGFENTRIRPLVCLFRPLVHCDDNFRRCNERGFNLIELMVALTVASILTVIAIPNMRTFIENTRIATQANDLVADASYARSEAIRRSANVGICASNSAGTGCLTGSDWDGGRLVFVDVNNDNLWTPGTDTIIRYREALSGNNTLRTPTSVPDPFVFGPRGQSTNYTGAGATFVLCDSRGSTFGRAIQINPIGQVSVLPGPTEGGTAPATCTP
ncbi:MAG: GspH/FimT family pseudopilin [Acidiferrobacterales bacterium]